MGHRIHVRYSFENVLDPVVQPIILSTAIRIKPKWHDLFPLTCLCYSHVISYASDYIDIGKHLTIFHFSVYAEYLKQFFHQHIIFTFYNLFNLPINAQNFAKYVIQAQVFYYYREQFYINLRLLILIYLRSYFIIVLFTRIYLIVVLNIILFLMNFPMVISLVICMIRHVHFYLF